MNTQENTTVQGIFLRACAILPPACFLAILLVAGLDITAGQASSGAESLLAGARAFIPGTPLGVETIGAGGWLLLAGMVVLLLSFPVWIIRETRKNWG